MEVTSDPLPSLSLHFDHDYYDLDDRIFSKRGESGKEVPNCALDVAECLVGLCSSSSASKVQKLISTLGQEEFDMKMFEAYVSSLVDCNRITISAWKRCPVELSLTGS